MNTNLSLPLNKIAILVEDRPKGAFIVLIYDRPVVREAGIAALRARVPTPVHEIALSANQQSAVQALHDLAPSPGEVVCFYDLEAAFPDAPGYFDLGREVLQAMHLFLVLWVTPYEFRAISQVAPNFYAVCALTADLTESVPAPPVTPLGTPPPRVFLSYADDTTETPDKVLELANRLRQDGIDCRLDRYEMDPAEGWPTWVERQITQADKVLVVCTENYLKRIRGGFGVRGGSALQEVNLVTQALYTTEAQTKFLPVVFAPQDTAYLPDLLGGVTPFDLSTEAGYPRLLSTLLPQTNRVAERLRLIQQLRALQPGDFQQIIATMGAGSHLPHHGSQQETVAALVEWADRAGKLQELREAADTLTRETPSPTTRQTSVPASEPMEEWTNPFHWRLGIRDPAAFFNRRSELSRLQGVLNTQGTCQIVGERRIGKTSLLLQVCHRATEWDRRNVVAYVDLQDSLAETQVGWMRVVSRQWGWKTPPETLGDFSEGMEQMEARGQRPVLCLDEFERFQARRAEFGSAFFLNLRACAQKGLAILTASREPLNRLTIPGDPSSHFYNSFALLRLEKFSEGDASDFVTLARPGVPTFTSEEREAILRLAKCHPLALQVACYYVLEAKRYRESLASALRKAEDEL